MSTLKDFEEIIENRPSNQASVEDTLNDSCTVYEYTIDEEDPSMVYIKDDYEGF